MSSVTISGNPSGSGTFTVQSPNSNVSRTITLPDATTTLVGTDATQTLTNKTIQGGALALDTAKTATGTAIDFTGIPSWAKRITVIFDGVSLSGASNIEVRLGDSGGIEATGYTSVGMTTTGAGGGFVTSTTGFVTRQTATGIVIQGHMLITQISGNKWVESHVLGDTGIGSAGVGGGNKTLSDTLTQIRITTVNGTDTFDAGTINIMYEG